MITAATIKSKDAILVEITYPNVLAKQYATVPDEAALERLLYFHQRRYIVDKLYSWLNQRKKALINSPDSAKIMDVAKLQVLLRYHRDIALPKLCTIIKDNALRFKAIAPANLSQHFSYYGSTVLPIINYCEAYA